jgi:hypothetical protein
VRLTNAVTSMDICVPPPVRPIGSDGIEKQRFPWLVVNNL